jgi:hypothetical protein
MDAVAKDLEVSLVIYQRFESIPQMLLLNRWCATEQSKQYQAATGRHTSIKGL